MQKRIDEASFFWEGDISPYLTSVSGVFSPKEIPFKIKELPRSRYKFKDKEKFGQFVT